MNHVWIKEMWFITPMVRSAPGKTPEKPWGFHVQSFVMYVQYVRWDIIESSKLEDKVFR